MQVLYKLLFSATFICICTGCIAIRTDDPIPSDWPMAVDMTCLNVAGRYIDPNSSHGTIATDAGGVHTVKGGTNDQAWDIFGFFNAARPRDPNVLTREFILSFDDELALNVTYWLNGVNVASKKIPKKEYRCRQGVLKFTSDFNDHANFDMGSEGSTSKSVELISAKQSLYAKYELVMRNSMSGIPFRSTVTTWPIFPVKPQ